MHAVMSQRNPACFNAGHFLDGPSYSSLWTSKVLAKNLAFHRRRLDLFVSRKQPNDVRLLFVRAEATTSGSGRYLAPLQPESPTGQFLVELLRSHPHLVSAAAEQQLDKLAEDRLAAGGQEHSSPGVSDMVLYKRIAELKAQERRTTVEEIMYALVSHRFVEAQISMVPRISSSVENQRVDNWPVQERQLLAVHSSEALEMVWEHLSFILGVKGATESLDDSIMVQITRLHMSQVYATSVLYGYFLRRVDEKFQMEKILLPKSATQSNKSMHQTREVNLREDDGFASEVLAIISAILGIGGLNQDSNFFSNGESTNLLRNYVLSFEVDTLYRCATIRSMESSCIIKRHTEALFGKSDVSDDLAVVGKEVPMLLSLAGLKGLILEAVAFGSFLFDVENLVDSHYTILT